MKKANEKPDTTFRFSVLEEKGDEVIIEVAPEDYASQLAAGVPPEEMLPPGQHKFIRGGFFKRHPNFDPAKVKTSVVIELVLDYEVLEFLKRKARTTQADAYQTVLRQILQRAMAQERQTGEAVVDNPHTRLSGDLPFNMPGAEQVQTTLSKKPVLKKAAQPDKRRRRAA